MTEYRSGEWHRENATRHEGCEFWPECADQQGSLFEQRAFALEPCVAPCGPCGCRSCNLVRAGGEGDDTEDLEVEA